MTRATRRTSTAGAAAGDDPTRRRGDGHDRRTDESGAATADAADEPRSTGADDADPGGDAGITADMVEAPRRSARRGRTARTRDRRVGGDAEVGEIRGRSDGATGRATAGSARAAARRQAVRDRHDRTQGRGDRARRADQDRGKPIFAWFARFLREVVAELRKVIWPTRKEMITYTVVVIVFVVFMVALVAGLDVLFAKGVLAVFG